MNIDQLINALEKEAPLYLESVQKVHQEFPREFESLGNLLCSWACKVLQNDTYEILAQGYKAFVSDVNRSQARYQRRGHYRNSSYKEVYDLVYNNPEYMTDYHWGVFVTTFAWEHHLKLFSFFENSFLSHVKKESNQVSLLDLGAGSGVWSLMSAYHCPQLTCLGIDISTTSVELAKKMADASSLNQRVSFQVGDALEAGSDQYDYAISCFLLEHLEAPKDLFSALSKQLKPGGLAWVSGALTAAEIDHIYEFKKESELVDMAEEAGFRVVGSLSLGPEKYPTRFKYLPRSMGMILQSKYGELW